MVRDSPHGYHKWMFEQRVMIPELMDDAGLDERRHEQALAGLRRLNAAAGAAAALARPIREVAWKRKLTRVSILDAACGGGDVSVAVAARLRSADLDVELSLTDRSPTALRTAQRAAKKAGFDARALHGAAPDALPEGEWDFVTNSLFLHHLQRNEVIATLRELARRARIALVLTDLRRTAAGYALAWGMCRLLSRSPIVHHDGPVSVRAAWTVEELGTMAVEAGLANATVRASWPARMRLVWERK